MYTRVKPDEEMQKHETVEDTQTQKNIEIKT